MPDSDHALVQKWLFREVTDSGLPISLHLRCPKNRPFRDPHWSGGISKISSFLRENAATLEDSWRNMVETFRRQTWGECGKESVFMQIVGRKLLPKIANKAWNVGPMFSGPRNRSVWFLERCDKWRHDKRNYSSQKNKNTTKTKQRVHLTPTIVAPKIPAYIIVGTSSP